MFTLPAYPKLSLLDLLPEAVEDENTITVYAPKDEPMQGFALDPQGKWSGYDIISPDWQTGGKTLVIEGATIVPSPEALKFGGTTVRLRPGVETVRFHHCIVYSGKGSAILAGNAGMQEKAPATLFFDRSKLMGAPLYEDEDISLMGKPKSGMILFQTTLRATGSHFHVPQAREHAVYIHHAPDINKIKQCIFSGAGGQAWQQTNRPHSGPNFNTDGPTGTVFDEVLVYNYGRHPSRAGSGLTFAGTGGSVWLERVVCLDLWKDKSRGALAVWRGGENPKTGEPNWFLSEDPVEDVVVKNCHFVHHNPERTMLNLAGFKRLVSQNNTIATTGSTPHPHAVKIGDREESEAPEDLFWAGNNTDKTLAELAELLDLEDLLNLDLSQTVFMRDVAKFHDVRSHFVYRGMERLK